MNKTDWPLLSDSQRAVVREMRAAAGWRPVSERGRPKARPKYIEVRVILIKDGAEGAARYLGAAAGDLLISTLRRRDRSLEVVRVEPDGTRHMRRYALAPRAGRRWIVCTPTRTAGERDLYGSSLRWFLMGSEFKTEAVARDVLRVFRIAPGRIAVVDMVPTKPVMGCATFDWRPAETIEVAA